MAHLLPQQQQQQQQQQQLSSSSSSLSSSCYTPLDMTLTEDEIRWALDIKSAVDEDDDLAPMSDFDYAQFALHTKGDTDLAIYKIHGIQEFRKEYKIQDDYNVEADDGSNTASNSNSCVEEGMDCLKAYIDQMPWLILDVEHDTEYGHHVLVLDYANLNPSVVDMPEDWRIQLSGLYFLHHCIQPNLFSIRQGMVRICELDGLTWKNFKVDFFRTTYHHLIEFFPMEHKEMSWVHASVIGNMLHSMFKAMNPTMASKIHIGCPFEAIEGRIDTIFKQPDEFVAKIRLLHKMKSLLQERQYNRKTFRLPNMEDLIAAHHAAAAAARGNQHNGNNTADNSDEEGTGS